MLRGSSEVYKTIIACHPPGVPQQVKSLYIMPARRLHSCDCGAQQSRPGLDWQSILEGILLSHISEHVVVTCFQVQETFLLGGQP